MAKGVRKTERGETEASDRYKEKKAPRDTENMKGLCHEGRSEHCLFQARSQ